MALYSDKKYQNLARMVRDIDNTKHEPNSSEVLFVAALIFSLVLFWINKKTTDYPIDSKTKYRREPTSKHMFEANLNKPDFIWVWSFGWSFSHTAQT